MPDKLSIYDYGYGKDLIKTSAVQLPTEQDTAQPSVFSDSGILSGTGLTPSQLNSLIPAQSISLAQTKLNNFEEDEDIQSSNFVSGSIGWRIKGNGDVEFNNGTFRGALTATTIDIGGSDTSSFHVDIDGNMWSGAATYAAAPFKVSNLGAVSATSGTIASFTIASTTITATNLTLTSGAANAANITVGTGATAGGLNSANAGSDIVFWAGSTFANRATASFRVNASGDLTATSATITGVTNVQTFTSSGTWTKPAGANFVYVICISGGGGGGGGGSGGNAAGSGGGGGMRIDKFFSAADISSSISITVGAGGTGGTVPGGDGGAGGSSSFGVYLTVFGGGGGAGGAVNGQYSGGSGAGSGGVGQLGQFNTDVTGGVPATIAGTNGISGQGAGGVKYDDGKNAEYGGGAGGGSAAGGGLNGGSSLFGAGGGGGGGGGGAGGGILRYQAGGGGASGANATSGVDATAGTAGADGNSVVCGKGGGGGGQSQFVGRNAGAGGAGGILGGGGGGGGLQNVGGGNPGAGGAGGRGEVRVYVWT